MRTYTTSSPSERATATAGLAAVVFVPVPEGQSRVEPASDALAECQALCHRLGFSVDAVLADQGTRPRVLDRPSIARLISLLSRTRPDVLVFHRWDQISKYEREREAFEDRVRRIEVEIHAVHNTVAPGLIWDSTDFERRQGRQART